MPGTRGRSSRASAAWEAAPGAHEMGVDKYGKEMAAPGFLGRKSSWLLNVGMCQCRKIRVEPRQALLGGPLPESPLGNGSFILLLLREHRPLSRLRSHCSGGEKGVNGEAEGRVSQAAGAGISLGARTGATRLQQQSRRPGDLAFPPERFLCIGESIVPSALLGEQRRKERGGQGEGC